MKGIGIVRNLDPMGRIVLPKELRNSLKIKHNDRVEFLVDGSKVILRKFETKCLICGNEDNVKYYKNKNICNNCLLNIKCI